MKKLIVLIMFLFVSSAVFAGPKENCESVLKFLGYEPRTYVFQEEGFFSKEKHIFNSALVCAVDSKKEIHSITDNHVTIVKDGFYGQVALLERDRLNKERREEIEKAKIRINLEYDQEISNLKEASLPRNISVDKVTKDNMSENRSLNYDVVGVEDISLKSAKRFIYRVRFGAIYTEREAMQIVVEIVQDRHAAGNFVNAVKFFIYFPGSDTTSAADGSIDWAPRGDWSKASSVTAGHYSTFRYKVNFYEYERALKIQGMAQDEDYPEDQLVGKWIEGGVGTASIIKKNGKYFLIRKFYDDSSLEQEIVEIPSSEGRRFDKNDGHGTYIVIIPNGDFLFRNKHHDGVITLAKLK